MKIIIGANYGDEGKGRTVSEFSDENTLNILTNGGAQRGHTVIYKGKRHVFHHFGSGTMQGAVSYFFKDFLIDPIVFLNELDELSEYNPKVFRDGDCRFVTPYDVIVNQELERHRDNKHGSCGMGIWETVKRYREMLCMSLDRFNSSEKVDKIIYLDCIKDRAIDILEEENALIEETREILESNILKENFINDVKRFCDIVPVKNIHEFDNMDFIFENAQGLLLNSDSNNIHTTPSETGCKNVVEFIEKEYSKRSVKVIYITRPYLTRHGAGQFVEEVDRKELNANFDETNIYNEFQGYIRYGKLNPFELKERIDKDFIRGKNNYYQKCICFTHADEKDVTELFTLEELPKFLNEFDVVYSIRSAEN